MKKKITHPQYAVFLYEAALGKKEVEIRKITKDFLGILIKNNDFYKIKEIIKEFEVYEKKQKGIVDLEIISAQPLAPAAKKQIVESIGRPQTMEVKETVNADLIGGLTLLIGDMMIDGSLRKKLKELNKSLSYG